jgi:hypothetical protein
MNMAAQTSAPHPVQVPARELTTEEAAERAELCRGLDRELKATIAEGKRVLWELARLLHEWDETSGWTALGYDSVGDWLADPAVEMTRSTFYRLVSTYRELVVRRRLDPADLDGLELSKAQVVLPAVKAGRVRLDDALADAKRLGKTALRQEYAPPGGLSGETPAPAASPPLPDDDEDTAPDDWTPPPLNDGTDTPTRASDVDMQPARIGDQGDLGQVPEVEPVEPPRAHVAHDRLADAGRLIREGLEALDGDTLDDEARALLASDIAEVRATLDRYDHALTAAGALS